MGLARGRGQQPAARQHLSAGRGDGRAAAIHHRGMTERGGVTGWLRVGQAGRSDRVGRQAEEGEHRRVCARCIEVCGCLKVAPVGEEVSQGRTALPRAERRCRQAERIAKVGLLVARLARIALQ